MIIKVKKINLNQVFSVTSMCVCLTVGLFIDSGSHKIVDKIFVNTRYFVMKSNNYDNVDIAKAKVKKNPLIFNKANQ